MIVAIGADRSLNDTGHVRVYQYFRESSTWNQIGQDIDGEAMGDRFGWSVSLSSEKTYQIL